MDHFDTFQGSKEWTTTIQYRLQGDECILCYTMLQLTTGATANLSTPISQL